MRGFERESFEQRMIGGGGLRTGLPGPVGRAVKTRPARQGSYSSSGYSSDPCTQMNDCRSIISLGRKSRVSRRTLSANPTRLAYVSQFGREVYAKSYPYSRAARRVTI